MSLGVVGVYRNIKSSVVSRSNADYTVRQPKENVTHAGRETARQFAKGQCLRLRCILSPRALIKVIDHSVSDRHGRERDREKIFNLYEFYLLNK